MSQDCTSGVLKRKISEVSSSCSCSSSSSSSVNLRKEMVQWNEVYTNFFLQLLDQCITNLGSLNGARKKTFWILFTEKLNNLIKENEPDFEEFEALEVLKRGKELRGLYNRFKTTPYVLANFTMYEKCFKKCESCMRGAAKCVRCRQTPIYSFNSVYEQSINRSSKRRKTTSGTVEDVTEQVSDSLSRLVEMRFISYSRFATAAMHFSEKPAIARSWLKFTRGCQIEYIEQIPE